jgi:uncharacterized protein (TIGR00730 family)
MVPNKAPSRITQTPFAAQCHGGAFYTERARPERNTIAYVNAAGRALTPREHDATCAQMTSIRAVCVYCGSSAGADPAFVAAAHTLGKILADNRLRLVYGGGSIGMMGALADAVLARGGNVTGIIPEFLVNNEHMLAGAQEIIVTRDMHERKRVMFEKADAFVALPGGIGTLEELVEQLTWAQLGRHRKPILLANIAGFWDPLCELLDHMNALGFIHSTGRLNYLIVDKVEDILPALRNAARAVEPATGDAAVLGRL